LEEQRFQLPSELILVGAKWEGQIELVGYQCEQCDNPQEATSLRLMLCWRALSTLTRDYTLFVHVVDAQGNIVAQRDQQPLGGVRPTSRWVPSEVLVDFIELSVPAEATGDRYQSKVGWYDALNSQHLPVVDGEDSVTLPLSLTVGP
jgi:hypothetical protein